MCFFESQPMLEDFVVYFWSCTPALPLIQKRYIFWIAVNIFRSFPFVVSTAEQCSACEILWQDALPVANLQRRFYMLWDNSVAIFERSRGGFKFVHRTSYTNLTQQIKVGSWLKAFCLMNAMVGVGRGGGYGDVKHPPSPLPLSIPPTLCGTKPWSTVARAWTPPTLPAYNLASVTWLTAGCVTRICAAISLITYAVSQYQVRVQFSLLTYAVFSTCVLFNLGVIGTTWICHHTVEIK